MEEYKNRRIVWFIILFILLIFLVFLNLKSGTVKFEVSDLIDLIFNNKTLSTIEYDVLFKIRLPRILSGIIFGAALSVSGFLIQTFFRNPIAGPFTLGISNGARLFVGFFILTNFKLSLEISSLYVILIAAFVGSLVTMGIVLIFAKNLKSLATLILVGIMIGYIASAGTNFMIAFASEHEIANMASWSLGSFLGINWDMLKISIPVVLIGILLTFLISKPLHAYLLGENYAKSVGVNVKAFRIVLIFLSSILAATVTAFAGPISFVGIAVPHLTKLSFKTSQPKILIPGIALVGADFCIFCDYLARTMFSPTELNISTVTSFIGAPIVIWLMLTKNKEG